MDACVRIPPGYGYLQSCEERRGTVFLVGWLLDLQGAFDRFLIRGPRGEEQPAEIDLRPALAARFPHLRHADRGGFRFRFDLPTLDSDETLELLLLGVRGEEPVARMDLGLHFPPTAQRFPPGDVMRRATGHTDPALFQATGIKACNDFRRVLRRHVDLDSLSTILDWGCGTGRLTKHLIDRFPNARVFGCDIDHEAVLWAQQNLAGSFVPCQMEPPLPYADERFDLLVALSIFTHLTEDYQRTWLRELRRVVRPGGIVLATVMGRFGGRLMLPDESEFADVFRTGFFDGVADHNLGHVASGEYYRTTYQSREYTESAWSGEFDVIDYVEGGLDNLQDVYVLRRGR